MEAYCIDDSSRSSGMYVTRSRLAMPSLAQCSAMTITLVALVAVYSVYVLQNQKSYADDLRVELQDLRQRVLQLEVMCQTRQNSEGLPEATEAMTKKEDAVGMVTDDSEVLEDSVVKLVDQLMLNVGDDGARNVKGDIGTLDYQAGDNYEDAPDHYDNTFPSTTSRDDSEVTNNDYVDWLDGRRSKRSSNSSESRNRNHKGSKNRREKGGGKSKGQRTRCDRYRDCQTEPAFAHFEGDIESATFVHPERVDPFAWKVMNMSDSWIHFWRFANWTPRKQQNKFELNNGNVTVSEGGVYYLYSQVQYFDASKYNGHTIFINGRSRFKCAVCPVSEDRKINTCYSGGLVELQANSVIGIKLAFPNRSINLHHDSSYFGLYKIV